MDRYLAYKPREEKIETLKDLSKLETVRLKSPTEPSLQSDLDVHIDKRYGLVEYHTIGSRIFARVVLNSIVASRIIDTGILVRTWCAVSSKDCTTEFSYINGDYEEFTKFANGSVVSQMKEGPGTFNKVVAVHDFRIGDVMQKIDENIDVLIAPRLVRELETHIKRAKQTVQRLKDLGIKDARIERDNNKSISQSERLLSTVKNDMYKEANVEEVYFRLEKLVPARL